MARTIAEVELDGVLYLIAELLGRSYLIRDARTDDIVGVFLVNEEGTRLAGADGINLSLTIRIAEAALYTARNTAVTLPPEADNPDGNATCTAGSKSASEIIDTWPPRDPITAHDWSRRKNEP